jgi:hypothetical protein
VKDVVKFLSTVKDEARREDCLALVELMAKATKAEPKMWGKSVVGFGDVHLVYESGRELDWFIVGFSPRKKDLTLYLGAGFELDAATAKKLGKHERGKGCLYVKALEDVNLPALKKLIGDAVKRVK